MVLRRHAQHFHGEKLHRQHQFSFVGQQQVHVRAGELHQQVRIFKIGMQMLPLQDFILHIEVQMVEYGVQELFDLRARRIDGILRFVHVL